MKRANDGGLALALAIYDGSSFRFQSSEGTLPLAVHLTDRYGPDWLKIIPVEADGFQTKSNLRAAAHAASPS